jgi:hypothetical protein
MLYSEIIAVCSQIHTKHCVGGTWSVQCQTLSYILQQLGFKGLFEINKFKRSGAEPWQGQKMFSRTVQTSFLEGTDVFF